MTQEEQKMKQVTEDEYNGLIAQLNNLQKIVIEQQNTISELGKSLLPTIQQAINWHEHTTGGHIFWNRAKMPPEIVAKMDTAQIQRLQTQLAAQQTPPKPTAPPKP
jgi:hypothetical protein